MPIVITEVLYNVPAGMDGDANADGARDAVGDEFVELYNRSSEPVSLRGWSITNRHTAMNDDAKRGVRFEFPAFDLPPKGVAVVFNGFESRVKGSVGSSRKAPTKPNDDFHSAWVFVSDNESKFNALNNAADFVLLADAKGRAIDCVVWGRPDVDPPTSCRRLEKAKGGDPKGSVARAPEDDELMMHRRLDGKPCSPGRVRYEEQDRAPKE